MDLGEIERYLNVSVAHSVTVDVRELAEAPGYLRTRYYSSGRQRDDRIPAMQPIRRS
jgi:hypothetical protein